MTEPADLLAPLRALAPAESTTIDVGRAIRTGKRRKRTRAGLVALAAVVLTLLALSPALLRTPESAPGTGTPREFDLLHQVVRVGTAGGYTPRAYQTGRYRHIVALSRTDDPTAPGGGITVYARGRHPDQAGSDAPPPGTPAPDVHGRRAVWPEHGDLAWEWAEGAWAVVSLDDGYPDKRDRAHRVAQSVLPAGTAIRVPMTVDGSTFGRVKLVGVRLALRPAPDIATLVFANNDAPYGVPEVYAVLREDYRLVIDGAGPAVTGDVSAVTDSVRVVDDPANRDNWVADPVR